MSQRVIIRRDPKHEYERIVVVGDVEVGRLRKLLDGMTTSYLWEAVGHNRTFINLRDARAFYASLVPPPEARER